MPKAWEALPALADQFDEPFADSSALPTWFVARETRRHVTVALTGDAGDELFAGYDRYRAVALAERFDRLPAGVKGLVGGPLARALPASSRAKTRLRSVKRWMEGVGQGFEARYLRWASMFDEPARASLYSDAWLDRLAEAGDADPDHARPGARHGAGPGRRLEARPDDARDGRGHFDVFARRFVVQGGHGEHGARPGVPRAVPGPSRGRTGAGDADPAQAALEARVGRRWC